MQVLSGGAASRPSLLVGASWLLAARTLSFAITTALPLILVRRLTIEEFGYYKQLFLVLISAANLLPLGMHMTLFYFLPRAQSRQEKGHVIFGVILFCFVTTGIAGGSLILFPQIVEILFHSSPLSAVGRQVGVVLIPYVISALIEYIMVADGEARLSAIAIIGINTVRTAFILCAAIFWGNIAAIIYLLGAFLILQSMSVGWYLLHRFGLFWRGFQWDFYRSQLSYGLPLGFAGLLWAIQLDIHNYFVSHYYNAATFAIYANGCFQLPLVGILSESAGSVLIPRISALQAGNATSEIVALSLKSMRALAFAYAPLFFFMSFAATQLITVLFTARFLDSVPIFRINLLMVPLSIAAVDPVVRAFKSQRYWMLRMNAFLFILLISALFMGITRFGLIGAISSVVALQYAARGMTLWRMASVLNVGWSDLEPVRDIAKTMLAALAAALVMLPVLHLSQYWGSLAALVIGGFVFGVVFLAGLLFLRVPTDAEVLWCRTVIANAIRFKH